MTPEQRKEIEERVADNGINWAEVDAQAILDHFDPENFVDKPALVWECPECKDRIKALLKDAQRTPALLSALDAAEARARDLEAALECSYTLACRGVDRIDEENKTCGPRLSLAHRKRLTIMCNQIRKHKDKWLRAEADRIEKESKGKDNG